MFRSRYVNHDPTTAVDKPKLKDEALMPIHQAVTNSSLPERNLALVSVLLHGLRASEVAALNLEDYDGQRLVIREAKADSKGTVPLTSDELKIKKELPERVELRQKSTSTT